MRRPIIWHLFLLGFVLFVANSGFWNHRDDLAASEQDNRYGIYLPLALYESPVTATDLRIVHIGAFQSVQNTGNGIPLVANKPTLLRIFAQATGNEGDHVSSVNISGYRDGQLIDKITSSAKNVPRQPSADNIDSTFNVALPQDWLVGDVTITATIDETNEVKEVNENNNSVVYSFTFHSVPVLDLTIVPFTYTDTVSGITYQPVNHDPVSSWLKTAYPLSDVNVRIREPYAFRGNLRNPTEWERLLVELTTLWAAEVGAGSSELYFGLVPTGNTQHSWFDGGFAGLGWIGQRVSVGLDFGAQTATLAAHEIGHNFGRRHAPCGNPINVDPHFPYPNGSIGVFGVNTETDTLHSPEHARDIMSYCGPEWLSDYTYMGLFENQLRRGRQTGHEAQGTLIRIQTRDGHLQLLPAYQFDGVVFPTNQPADQSLQILNREGMVQSTYPVNLFEAEEHGTSVEMLMAYIPEVLQDGDRIRLIQNDQILMEQQVVGNGRSDVLSSTLDTQAGSPVLQWNDTGVPALIRYRQSEHDDWLVLAVDQMDGKLVLDQALLGSTGQFEVIFASGFTRVGEPVE